MRSISLETHFYKDREQTLKNNKSYKNNHKKTFNNI